MIFAKPTQLFFVTRDGNEHSLGGISSDIPKTDLFTNGRKELHIKNSYGEQVFLGIAPLTPIKNYDPSSDAVYAEILFDDGTITTFSEPIDLNLMRDILVGRKLRQSKNANQFE